METDGEIRKEYIDEFKNGFDIGLKNNTKPALLEIIDENKAYVTITEENIIR